MDCYSRIDYSHWNVYGTFHGAYSPLCVIVSQVDRDAEY